MSIKIRSAVLVAIALGISAVPVHAQSSDGYKFLKAIREGNGEEVDKLLSIPTPALLSAKERDSGWTALHILASQRNLTWLGYMLGKGGRLDIQDKDGNTPLAIAAQMGWTEGAAEMLARKANVDSANKRGETPLILAVLKRDLPMVRLLVRHGADPKKADSSAGYSALDYAKRDTRSQQIVKALETSRAAAIPGR